MVQGSSHPGNWKSLATYFGINFTFGSILSWLASLASILTLKNGILIFGILFTISIGVYLAQLFRYYKVLIESLNKKNFDIETSYNRKIEEESQKRKEVQVRLEK